MTTATVELPLTDDGCDAGGDQGSSGPEEAPDTGGGPTELPHVGSALPGGESRARRRLFADLGVSEDELLKLVSNAEFVVGVKCLKAAADAAPFASGTDTPMVVEVPNVGVAPVEVGAPVAAEVEGDLDSDGGSVPSDSPAAPVAGVEEDLADYE